MLPWPCHKDIDLNVIVPAQSNLKPIRSSCCGHCCIPSRQPIQIQPRRGQFWPRERCIVRRLWTSKSFGMGKPVFPSHLFVATFPAMLRNSQSLSVNSRHYLTRVVSEQTCLLPFNWVRYPNWRVRLNQMALFSYLLQYRKDTPPEVGPTGPQCPELGLCDLPGLG